MSWNPLSTSSAKKNQATPVSLQIQAQALREKQRRESSQSVELVSDDAFQFIDSFCRIDDVQLQFGSEGTYPFRLWPKQREVLEEILSSSKVVILKARQLGISWLVCAYVLFRALFRPNQMILLFSRGQEEANELLRRVKVLYERLPVSVQDVLPKPGNSWNTGTLEWDNGSRVKSFPATPSSGRTYTASLVVIDEFAFLEYASQLWTAVKPTTDGGGQLIVLSTANGLDNLFKSLWDLAKTDSSAYTSIFLNCLDRPDRSLQWYQEKRSEALDLVLFDQEYPLTEEDAFVVSARSPFLPNRLWWDPGCRTDTPWPSLDPRTGLVVALDASLSGDSFGLVGVGKHPRDRSRLAVRVIKVWYPQPGEQLDHREIQAWVLDLIRRSRVYQLCYDPYQLHLFCQQVGEKARVWVEPFQQGAPRLIADSGLLDCIRDGTIVWDPELENSEDLTQHLYNSDRKVDPEEHKLRIVKGGGKVIDLAVCLSMAANRALGLNL